MFMILNKSPDNSKYLTITESRFSKATYKGNVVSNAQAIVAKAAKAGEFEKSPLSVKRSTISSDTLAWIEADSDAPESRLFNFMETNDFLCNGDIMFHVNKGVIGLRMDNVQHSKVNQLSIKRVKNTGDIGTSLCKYSTTEISHPGSHLPGYQGATTRGVLLAGCEHNELSNLDIQTIDSYSGAAYGIDVETDTHDVSIHDVQVRDVKAGANEDIMSYNGLYAKNPNKQPLALGIRVAPTADNVHLGAYTVNDIYGLEENWDNVRNPDSDH
jgi:hypothetical protein